MTEYQAGRGTTALGIVGTVLGSLGTALGARCGMGNAVLASEPMINGGWCNTHDVIAQKDSEIARLSSEKYTDGAVIELYKYIDGKLKEINDEQNAKWTEQAVINCNLKSGLSVLSNQAAETSNLLSKITQVAIPKSAICDFNDCCDGCTSC